MTALRLENYAYNMRNTVREEKVASQLSASDKDTLEKAVNEAIEWLEQNQMAEVEEYEHKLKQCEQVRVQGLASCAGSARTSISMVLLV